VPITDYAYDDLDRVSRVTKQLTAAEGGARFTDTTYFKDGKVASVTRGVGTTAATTVSYTYTPNGLQATLKDGRDYLATFEYDGYDRRHKLRHPAPATVNTSSTTDFEQYGYDANNNLTSVRLRNGSTVTSAYDNLNRVTARTYATAADNVTFSYDLLGRVLSSSKADHAISNAWDNAGRQTSTTAGGRTLAYQYDAAGNRTRITWPDGFYVTTSYDALNRPTSIKENDAVNLVTSYAYDDLSRRATVTLGNTTTTTYAYGLQGPVSQIVHNLAATANDVTFALTRNQKLDITNRTATSTNGAYRWAPTVAATRNYTANGLNQYTAVAGAILTYDTRGNLTGDGTWTWAYDDVNQLKTASRTGTSVALTYDATGRMRQEVLNGTTTTQFMYPGGFLLRAALDGWIAGDPPEKVRQRAAAAYAKNQKISVKAAAGIFTAGRPSTRD
jgi:YD repeat-containing protein